MEKITFDLNNDNRPIIDKDFNSFNIKEKFFEVQYETALSRIDNYIREVMLNSLNKDSMANYTDNINNIIAFVGDRGSGKTSCMLSVAELLREKQRKATFVKFPYLTTTDFTFMGMIDPSYFDGKHNLLSLFVAKLCQNYQKNVSEHNINQNDKNELLDSFSRVQRHLMIMLDEEVSQRSSLEQLSDLSSAQSLKQDICDLINTYLNKIAKGSKMLLLLVDDIDLNTSQGAYMAELLRKYFILPNVVVMISIKLDQFASIKRLEYTNEYKTLLDKELIKEDEIDEMVERYIAKLLPQSQRIYMPDVVSFMDIPLEITDKDNKKLSFDNVKLSVPKLVFNKTRYLFFNSEQQVSLIVPRNLRELRQLLRLLCFMEEPNGNSVVIIQNQTIFRKYLFENWVLNNLSKEYRSDINDILGIESYSQLNNKVLKILKNRYKNVLEHNRNEGNDEVYSILADKNVDYNISLGDVIGILDSLERILPQMVDKRFFFLIRSIYSMRLFKSYKQLKEKETHKSQMSSAVYVNERLSHISEYHRLIGGRIVNTRITDFLPRIGDFSSRSIRPIDAVELSTFIESCVSNWNDYLENGYVKLAEFFMLCTFKSINKDESPNIQSDTDDRDFRTYSQCAYDFRDFKSSMTFDLGAFFFNITRVEACYKRFYNGVEFWNKIKETKVKDYSKTLYGSFIHKNDESVAKLGDYSEYAWLPNCCLRNMEIIQDFINWLSQVDVSSKDDAFKMIQKFFNKGSKYKVYIYEDDVKGKPKCIDFPYMGIVADFFATKNDDIKDKFYKIYPNDSITEMKDDKTKEMSSSNVG